RGPRGRTGLIPLGCPSPPAGSWWGLAGTTRVHTTTYLRRRDRQKNGSPRREHRRQRNRELRRNEHVQEHRGQRQEGRRQVPQHSQEGRQEHQEEVAPLGQLAGSPLTSTHEVSPPGT